LVFGEVMAGARPQMSKQASKDVLVGRSQVLDAQMLLADEQRFKLRSDFANGQNKISDTGGDGAARHRRVFSFTGVLHQDQSAGFLDGLHAHGAIRSSTRQYDREAITSLLGERSEEKVNGRALSPRLIELNGVDLMIGNIQSPVRHDDIHAPWLERHASV